MAARTEYEEKLQRADELDPDVDTDGDGRADRVESDRDGVPDRADRERVDGDDDVRDRGDVRRR